MIQNPVDANGDLMLFPGAPAPDPVAHRAGMLQHLIACARQDSSYARWRAAELERDNPDWFAGFLTELDTAMAVHKIPRRAPFIDIPSRLPVLAKGRRGLPKRKFFHDTL
ncbi:hypothetical protein [Variovorax sp. dw_954]|uniref:hypothetical protein n=1 Tax=Variovorax sp. dw_954 TaxID=2720078 RepID=UPI001BD62084|nr:hypothetical protein [Variovorax sp. dw_954]